MSFPFTTVPDPETKAIDAEFPATDVKEPAPSMEKEGPARAVSLGGFRRPAASEPSVVQRKNIIATTQTEVKKTKKVLASRASTIPDKQVVVDLEDVLPQIPEQYLKTGRAATGKKELRFNSYELLPGLSLGKAVVALSRVAELMPDLFSGQQPPASAEVKLPLAKIVAQIGAFPARPDQMEEQFPPLDPQYAKLIIEHGVPIEEIISQPIVPAIVEPEPAPALAASAPEPAAEEKIEPAAKVEAEPSAVIPEAEEAPAEVEEIIEEAPEPEPPVEDEKVSYSLAALLAEMPKAWIAGDLKAISDAARIVVPFRLVEEQLATGKVELGYEDFFKALPEEFQKLFSNESEEAKSAKLQIPLNEVFQNLPGVEPLAPLPKSATVEIAPKIEEAPAVAETVETPPPANEELKVVEAVAPAEVEAPKAEVVEEEKQPASVVSAEPAVSETETAPEIKIEEKPVEPVGETQVSVSAPAEPVEKTEAHPIAAEVAEAKIEDTAPPATEQPASEVPPPAEIAPTPEEPEAKPEPPAPPGPAFIEPPVIHVPAPALLVPPRIQPQRMAPPPILPKEAQFAAADVPQEVVPPENVVEFDSSKILAFSGTISAFTPDAVENLFTTDGKLDSEKTTGYVTRLSGVQAVVLTVGDETKTSGDMPHSFNMDQTRNAASILFQSLANPAAQPSEKTTQNVTLHHDGFSSTWFKQGGVQLGVVHPLRALEEMIHGKLVLVAEEVARLLGS